MRNALMLSLSFAYALFACPFYEQHFTKTCTRCKEESHEIQLYVWNEWTQAWVPSWRSNTNRPNICERCYYDVQPKPKFLEPNIYIFPSGKRLLQSRTLKNASLRIQDDPSSMTKGDVFVKGKGIWVSGHVENGRWAPGHWKQ